MATRITYWVQLTTGSYVSMDPQSIAEMLATGFELTILVTAV